LTKSFAVRPSKSRSPPTQGFRHVGTSNYNRTLSSTTMAKSSPQRKQHTLLVDGTPLIFRAFRMLPVLKAKSPEGIPVGACYGYSLSMLKIIREWNYDHVAFCFDSGSMHRLSVNPDYKKNRPKLDTVSNYAGILQHCCIYLAYFASSDPILQFSPF